MLAILATLSLGLPLAPSASAKEPEHPLTTDPRTKAGGHGTPSAGAPDASTHGGGHGGDHAHHYYTDDDDHDGTPNWADAMNGTEPNKDTYVLQALGLHTFNLLVVLLVGAWFVRRPIGDFFRERALGVRTELTDAARKRDEAHQRHQEVLARLAKLDAEITLLEQNAERDAQREEEQLVERARREAARIGEQAERNVRDEVLRARNALRAEAVELAVKLAETTLRAQTSGEDQRRLARAFLDSVSHAAGGPRV